MNIKDAVKQKAKKQLEDNLSKAKKRCEIAETLVRQSFQLEKKELISKAVDVYLFALNLYPNLPEAYIGLAYIEFSFGSPQKSLKLLNQAKKISSENIELDNLIKTVKKEIKNIEKEQKSNIKKIISKKDNLNKTKESIFEKLFSSFYKENIQKIDEVEKEDNKELANNQFMPKSIEFKATKKMFQNTEGDSYISISKKSNDEILASLDIN